MKNNSFLFIVMIILSVISVTYAQVKNDSFIAEEPILITSAGQSADILMVKVLAKKSMLDYKLDKLVQPEDLDGVKSLIIVCGGSTKGLGAAKIDKEQEYARVEEIIKVSKKNDVKIIAINIGGKARRGVLSDYFNNLVANNADHIIVLNTGNEDGYFSKIAENNGISIDITEKIILIIDVLKRIYNKE